MNAQKHFHVKEPKPISGKDILRYFATKFWNTKFGEWLKGKIVHILVTVICIGFLGLLAYVNIFAKLPTTLNELKANQVKNEALIQQSIKKSDSIANQKVDKSDFQKEVILINNSMQHLDEKTDILYENLIGEKYKPVKK